MSVRVVARVRPLVGSEREVDIIVRTGNNAGNTVTTTGSCFRGPQSSATTSNLDRAKEDAPERKFAEIQKDRDTNIRIPNPKNEGEGFSFQFNAVYDESTSQGELFDGEVAPTVKHLFKGLDVTIFAYGVTGTGKTHTMRGGKSLADRGLIPRLLSAIYRRARKIEKDSGEASKVSISMSYYEIYNDKVYDLFEPPDKRTLAGLPLRDNGSKTIVVGLTERPCMCLKEFESLYDHANLNRSTSATKLNTHSSRSHAILCVKVTITTGDQNRVSAVSAIDLAGSEDNRRTENGKERMVESASINKSLFVLAQCVEAIGKKSSRIPYRESKMTRILSLGQNNGFTLMILNLAPVRSYHLDTISSLNFANRTKKIEIREVENEPMFRGPLRPAARPVVAGSMQRQPLRSLAASINTGILVSGTTDSSKLGERKPVKAFHVFSDKPQTKANTMAKRTEARKQPSPLKRGSGNLNDVDHPAKFIRYTEAASRPQRNHQEISEAKIEEMVERKVGEILAARAFHEPARHKPQPGEISEQVQRRLEHLERRLEGAEGGQAEGLSYLSMAKQHYERGEERSALKLYELALPFFLHSTKLRTKISTLSKKLGIAQRDASSDNTTTTRDNCFLVLPSVNGTTTLRPKQPAGDVDEEYKPDFDSQASDNDNDNQGKPELKSKARGSRKPPSSHLDSNLKGQTESPRTTRLLSVINSRDVNQIKLLKGVGAKKAAAIIDCLSEMDHQLDRTVNDGYQHLVAQVQTLEELGRMRGIGLKTVENMRCGVVL